MAGLPDRCITHSLRKAVARLLAEASCTANEIAGMTGHRILVEVSRNTKAADQVHLAQTAIDRLTARQSAQRVPTPVKRVGENPKNRSEIKLGLFKWRAPAGGWGARVIRGLVVPNLVWYPIEAQGLVAGSPKPDPAHFWQLDAFSCSQLEL